MANFQFRLQKVLEYRELQEGWAKDAYIGARAVRLGAEAAVEAIDVRRKEVLGETPTSLNDHQVLDRYLTQLDDEERTQKHVIVILETEEGNALVAWQDRKQALEALVKLRERAREEFELVEKRSEQTELDEWTATRRKSA